MLGMSCFRELSLKVAGFRTGYKAAVPLQSMYITTLSWQARGCRLPYHAAYLLYGISQTGKSGLRCFFRSGLVGKLYGPLPTLLLIIRRLTLIYEDILFALSAATNIWFMIPQEWGQNTITVTASHIASIVRPRGSQV